MSTFYSSIRSLFLVASFLLGLTALVVPSVVLAQDTYLAEVEAGVNWIDLDLIYGEQPDTTPSTGGRPYLRLERREFTTCPGESLNRCVRVVREKNQQNLILTFWGSNPTTCRQDGYSLNPQTGLMQTGVPAGYKGLMEGFTFRPCSPGATYGVTGSAATVGASSSVDMSLEAMDLITETESVTSTFEVYSATVTTAQLRIRSTPNASGNGNVVGFVYADNVVTVTNHSEDGIWAEVGQDEWVARAFLRAGSEVVAASQMTITATATVAPVVPTRQVTATAVATAVPTVAPTAVPTQASVSNGNGPTQVTVLEGSANWVPEGSNWRWNTYQHADGQPVKMKLDCPMNGEYFTSGGSSGATASPIPAGTWWITGITAVCNN